MAFNVTFGSDDALNIGFQNPNTVNVSFGRSSRFQTEMNSSQNINAGFDSSDPMNAEFGNYGAIFYDTKENWNRQTMLIARRKAIYVYSNYSYLEDEVGNKTYIPAIKVGDGTSYLIDMPFVSDDIRKKLIEHIAADGIHVTEEDRRRWNNKVTAFIDANAPERLVLSKL